MTDVRTYIKVHDGIEDHPKIAPLSDKAFRLLVTTWGWCSRHLTDGRVPLKVWNKRGTKRARDELLAAKLVEVCDGIGEPTGGYVLMHDYLEHQRSAALVEEKREAKRQGARKGNHNRWHRDQGVYDETCPFCTQDGPPDSSHKRSDSDRISESLKGSRSDRKTSPETETETETEKRSTYVVEQPYVSNTRGIRGSHSADAYRLVDRTLGRELTSGTRTALAIEVATLMPEVDEPTLAAALERWNTRTGIGPRVLGGLVDDIRKERHGATNRAPNGHTTPQVSQTDVNIAAFLRGNTQTPSLRALPGGNA